MLLLVTLALVVASAVLLILGFVQDALGFIYLSMLCAGVAALALFIFARLTRRRSAALGVGPAVAGDAGPYATDNIAPAPAPTGVGGPTAPAAADEADTAVLVATPASAPSHEVGGQPDDPWAAGTSSTDWGDEVVFPIEDYDDLRVAEILPLLSQLEADELQEVRDRELAGKARATILDRIDDRLNRSRPLAVTNREDTAETAVISVVEPPSDAGAGAPADAVWAAPAAEAPKKRGGRKKAAAPVVEAEPAPASQTAGSSADVAETPSADVAAEAAEADVAAEAEPAPASQTAGSSADVGAEADAPAPVRAKRAYTRRTPAEKAAATKTTATKIPAKKAAAKKSAAAGAVPADKAAGATKAAAKKAAGTAKKAPGPTKRATKKAADS